ncbi:MAG: FHA domain-containing protein, partial [Planctomycetota bacterium]
MGWLKGAALAAGEGGVEIPPRGSILCGRSPRSDLPIPGRGVSRRHAIFWHRAGLDWVEDAGSTNGTFVNDVRVEGAAPLGDGDVITIGGLRLRYSLSAPASAAPAEPPPAAAPAPPPDAPTTELPALPWRPFTDTPRWRQVTLIGRGGMGEVYRAYDRDLAAPVAIKRLRRRGGDRDRILERLHAREAAIGRTIQHPNVVQVLEDGLHDGDPYILLDWVEGATLGSRIGEEGWSFGDRIELLRQIALARAAAPSVGGGHADQKPSKGLRPPDTRGRDAASNLGILEAPEESEHGDASALGALEEDQALAREIADRIDLPEIPLLETPPFVGRGGEMELLREIAREAAKEDQVRWVLVCGEKGVGKRRLCEEFIAGWREPPQGCEAHLSDEWVPPPEGTKGIWLTMLPPFLPDDPALQLAYERGRRAGVVREIYLKPFLRGQAVRMVERVVRHPPSARAFVDAVGRETGGSPERLRATLLRSFEEGAWARSG